jgi:prophage DNA circulation protein
MNIIAALPPLRWRGLTAPCETASYQGGHDQARRRYPYKDAASHDNTGRQPYVTTVVLHFNNGIGRTAGSSDYPNGKPWYPDYWNDWKLAIEDGSIGELQHPDLGTFQARVMAFSLDLTAQYRSGARVTVTWEESIEDLTEQPQFETASVDLGSAAKKADEECAKFGISYPDGQGATSLFDMVNQIEGALFSLSLSVNGLLNRALGAVNFMFDAVEALNDPSTWPAADALLQTFNALRATADKIARAARTTAKTTTTAETTLDAFATSTGNTLQEIQGLNLFALRSPLVPKGTTLTYYTDK